MPEKRSVRTRVTICPELPAMNSTEMPNRLVNLGMISWRITGSGEPTTTTLPSFFAAASVSSHVVCQDWACAMAHGAATIEISESRNLFIPVSCLMPAARHRRQNWRLSGGAFGVLPLGIDHIQA